MKTVEPVALGLQHLAESDRERQRHITVVGSPGGAHHNRDGRSQSRWKMLVRLQTVAACFGEVNNLFAVSDTTTVSHSTAAPTLGDTAAMTTEFNG